MLVFASSIIFKLIDIQFTNGDYYRELSENRVFKSIEIPANRGNIYSENGRLLATSVPKYDIRFDALAPSDKNFNKFIFCAIKKHFKLRLIHYLPMRDRIR